MQPIYPLYILYSSTLFLIISVCVLAARRIYACRSTTILGISQSVANMQLQVTASTLHACLRTVPAMLAPCTSSYTTTIVYQWQIGYAYHFKITTQLMFLIAGLSNVPLSPKTQNRPQPLVILTRVLIGPLYDVRAESG